VGEKTKDSQGKRGDDTPRETLGKKGYLRKKGGGFTPSKAYGCEKRGRERCKWSVKKNESEASERVRGREKVISCWKSWFALKRK